MISNAVISLIAQLDSITIVVLGLLLVLSLADWTITLFKMIVFVWKKKILKRALRQIDTVFSEKELILFVQAYESMLPEKFIAQIIAYQTNGHDYSYVTLQAQQEYIIDQLISQEESLLPFLSMSAAIAPLLGLFGTVWGLINSFMAIGMQQSADIATIAPGIAQALVTTLVGLCVAIPAVALASFLYGQIRGIEQLLVDLSQKVLFIVMKQKQNKEGQCVGVTVEAGRHQSPMSH